MANKYGPWATQIDVGDSPQLSAFWRRRLVMLVPASQTNPVLSRRNLLWLVAAGILTCVLPTFFFAPAAAEEKQQEGGSIILSGQTNSGTINVVSDGEKPADKASPANVPTAEKQQPAMNTGISIGLYATYTESFYVPGFVYFDLSRENTRKELKISDEQEKKLREISGNYFKHQRAAIGEVRKDIDKLSPEEQRTRQRDHKMRMAEEEKNVCKQIEELLTPDQLTALKSYAVGMHSGRLLTDSRLAEKIGLSDQQKKELSKQLGVDEILKEKNKKFEQSLKEYEEKLLAVITPQQWDEIERLAGDSEAGIAGPFSDSYPGIELQQLQYPDVQKELILSAEQQTKLQDIFAKSQAQAMELSKLGEKQQLALTKQQQKEQAANDAEFMQKIKDMLKQDRDRIEALLTPQQFIALKKKIIRKDFLHNLITAWHFGYSDVEKDQPGILNRINASREQKEELRRLHEENDSMIQQRFRDMGEIVLKILSPQQQEKLLEALDPRNDSPDAAESKSSSKTGAGIMTISGNVTASDSEQPTDAAKPADKASPANTPTAEKQQPAMNAGTFSIGLYTQDTDSIYIPVFIYFDLSSKNTRKELKLSDEQEKKLREISGNYSKQQQAAIGEVRKNIEKLSPEEQLTRQRDYMMRIAEEEKSVRKQIEELLTPDQLTALKSRAVGILAGRLLTDPRLGEKIGLTAEQKNELSKQLKADDKDKEKNKNIQQLLKENGEKSLAVITPRQWDEIERLAGESEAGIGGILSAGPFVSGYPGIGLDLLQYPDVQKELNLSAEQQKKLQDIVAKSQAQGMELSKLGKKPQQLALTKQQREEQAANYAEIRQKIKDMIKQDHDRIEALLTPQQFIAFKKKTIRQEFLRSLITSWRSGSSNFEKELSGIFDRINASQEQKEEFRRLHEENDRIVQQKNCDMGNIVLKILSPQQQEKLIEALDPRNDSPDGGESNSTTKEDAERMPVNKIGGGQVYLYLSAGTVAPADATQKPYAPATDTNKKAVNQQRPVLIYRLKPKAAMTDAAKVDMEKLLKVVDRRLNAGPEKIAQVGNLDDQQIEVVLVRRTGADRQEVERLLALIGTLEFRVLANNSHDKANIDSATKDPSKTDVVDESGNRVAWWVPVKVGKEGNFTKPEIVSRMKKQDNREIMEILVVTDPYNVSDEYITRALPSSDSLGHPCIEFTFNETGGQLFGKLTGDHLPDNATNFAYSLGIIVDGELTSAPSILSVITARGIISGSFTKQEASDLADTLSLPVRLQLVEEPTNPDKK